MLILVEQIWQGHNPVADSEMTTLIDKMVDDGAACEALCALRKVCHLTSGSNVFNILT